MVCDKKERQAQGISVMWVKIGQSITNNFYKYTSYNGFTFLLKGAQMTQTKN